MRRRILHDNIHGVDTPAFVPQDMPVREFAEVLNDAVAEHLRNRRLLFRDTMNITFGPSRSARIRPVVDTQAHALLQKSRDEYMELQVNKLLENALNRKVAAELLRQKCGVCPSAMEWNRGYGARRRQSDRKLVHTLRYNRVTQRRFPAEYGESGTQSATVIGHLPLRGDGARDHQRQRRRRQDQHRRQHRRLPGQSEQAGAPARCGPVAGQSRPGDGHPEQI